MTVTTAIIFAAGFGSRMVPITAGVDKVLLPVLERPIVDYVVADCVAAGIHRIIFVIAKGSHGLQDYYLSNPALERYLERYHKTEALAALQQVRSQAKFEFIEQPEDAGYGTAVPVRTALPLLGAGESAFISDGDTFSWHTQAKSETAGLIRLFERSSAAGAVMGLERPPAELSRYGVLDLKPHHGLHYLRGLIEKPAPGQAPSNLINISKYIITPSIRPYIQAVTPDPRTGEYYLTDAFHAAARDLNIVIYQATGKLLDAGSVQGWLEANLTVARSRPDLAGLL